jgi:macrodomain Ter protein organizer (MatP/YcbG family)
MIINDREVKFFYSIDAYCRYNDWVVAHQNASVSRAMIEQAILMNQAYNRAHGIDETQDLTYAEIKDLPFSVFNQLTKEADDQKKADSEVTVETKEPKRKNAKNPHPLS